MDFVVDGCCWCLLMSCWEACVCDGNVVIVGVDSNGCDCGCGCEWRGGKRRRRQRLLLPLRLPQLTWDC
jgi:hypothetical protein